MTVLPRVDDFLGRASEVQALERAYGARGIRPLLDAYFGSCFERLCREALPWLYASEGVGAAFETGEFWDRDVQIDVVGLRDDGVIDLGECKWGALRSARALEKELEDKIPRFPNSKNATLARRVFVRTGVSPPAGSKVKWHSLADLYEHD